MVTNAPNTSGCTNRAGHVSETHEAMSAKSDRGATDHSRVPTCSGIQFQSVMRFDLSSVAFFRGGVGGEFWPLGVQLGEIA